MAKVLEGLATADWHLCGLSKHFPNDIERQFYEINKIYQYAVKNGVEHIFVNGDISDTPHMPTDVYIALVLFLKKYDGIIHTHYIAGNHDFSDIKKTSMDLLDVLVRNDFFKSVSLYLNAESTKVAGVPVNFLPYPCVEAPESDVPHLNFSHVEYNGAVGDNGRKLRTKDEFIQNPGDFNVSGHIHTYQYLKAKRAVYSGNPFQKNFGEGLPKGFLHFKATAGSDEIKFKHKFINNKPDFQLINVQIESREDFAKLSDSDAYRYKLWVSPSVEVPRDLRVKFPNITGGIFDLDSKKQAEVPDMVEDGGAATTPTTTRRSLRQGLTDNLRSKGFKKRQVKDAHAIVKQAANELGLNV